VREMILQTPGSVKKEGEEVLRQRSRHSLAAPGADHGEAGCAPAANKVHGGADLHLQPMEDAMLEQGDARRSLLTPWEAVAGAGTWQDLWPRGERSPHQSRFANRTCDPAGDPHWSSLFLKDCSPWKGPTLEQFVKNCSPWEGLKLEQFVEDCLPWEGPHAGAGEEGEKEGEAETTCDELTTTPFLVPLHRSGGGGREIGSEVEHFLHFSGTTAHFFQTPHSVSHTIYFVKCQCT